MVRYLVVTKPFLEFVRGDVIGDSTKISEILATEHKKFVTKVATPNTSKG